MLLNGFEAVPTVSAPAVTGARKDEVNLSVSTLAEQKSIVPAAGLVKPVVGSEENPIPVAEHEPSDANMRGRVPEILSIVL